MVTAFAKQAIYTKSEDEMTACQETTHSNSNRTLQFCKTELHKMANSVLNSVGRHFQKRGGGGVCSHSYICSSNDVNPILIPYKHHPRREGALRGGIQRLSQQRGRSRQIQFGLIWFVSTVLYIKIIFFLLSK